MILDHIDHLELAERDVQRRHNEIQTLQYLRIGLHYLYSQVSRVEQEILRRVGRCIRYVSYGNDPQLAWAPRDWIACSFHWYAVSACNYVWLVGWLAQQVNASRSEPRKYADSIIPAIVRYRHKVGAHLAKVFPKSDSVATMDASVIPVTFDRDAFYAGAMTVTLRRQGQATESARFRWSLTKSHEELTPRYWPDQKTD
jgi:hypothetical protein